ncbi:tyrosine-type recombinase/integrase [Sphaerospermopsis kisseleviana CS-549]|uniref:Tyrosine-type recombinase/integrase n=1 Tax=Sphaerospermopsis kisseleviana CS-549 TaxID=3021783 RepID=A0ABT4ZM49_9CYAN|nr:tyrosine-type recombinase/integrase [Sphaerospermopsis kisseleviana]MDB9440476.1 tyrosine-type recombinase/integrase [Sphaerospermopsis kisseleviana CS-549]BAZ83575.1 phage integrase [Sphaerospermopsis kisseleviana NIES-73]
MKNNLKVSKGKAKKGQVTVRLDSGIVRACFPRTHFADDKQLKLATGIATVQGWEIKAGQLQRKLQLELEEGKLKDKEGNFNLARYREILEEYGLRAKLRVVDSTVSTKDNQVDLNLLEIWDRYCEYRKHSLAETTYKLKFQRHFRNIIVKALSALQDDNKSGFTAIEFKEWLINNVNLESAKSVLQHLSRAYDLAVSQECTPKNIFKGLADDISIRKRTKVIRQEDVVNEDADILNIDKAFSWEEALEILKYIQSRSTLRHYYNYTKFKFFTGCRPGEASALWWSDIRWKDECILIRRTYNEHLKIFKPTKNETVRMFPIPKGGELWDLIKSIPEGEPNEVVFKNRQGKIIRPTSFFHAWHGQDANVGIIPDLIEQGKISKYLPPYNTRHTFVSYQINVIGIPPHIVNAWCDHSEEISQKHYRQLDLKVVPGYNKDKTEQQQEIDLLKEQLRRQQELINELMNGR